MLAIFDRTLLPLLPFPWAFKKGELIANVEDFGFIGMRITYLTPSAIW